MFNKDKQFFKKKNKTCERQAPNLRELAAFFYFVLADLPQRCAGLTACSTGIIGWCIGQSYGKDGKKLSFQKGSFRGADGAAGAWWRDRGSGEVHRDTGRLGPVFWSKCVERTSWAGYVSFLPFFRLFGSVARWRNAQTTEKERVFHTLNRHFEQYILVNTDSGCYFTTSLLRRYTKWLKQYATTTDS